MKQLRIDVLRGSMTESTHAVDLLAMDDQARVVISVGQVERSTFPRSAIKPMQAMLFASIGEPKSETEKARIALSSASHWAQASQLQIIEDWHRECGLSDADLICGPQSPRDSDEQRRLLLENKVPRRVHNNCSGKHTGFLRYCQHKNYPLKDYGDFNHPLQVELRQLLGDISGTDWHSLPWGIDGCGIPTSFVPLQTLAKLSSNFLALSDTDERVRRIVNSIRSHPDMIAGTQGFCTQIIQESKGEWLIKTGAEGNYFGINLRTRNSFFLKVRDGGTRASEHAVLWVMRELGAQPEFLAQIDARMARALVNWAGENIGQLRATATP